MPLQAILRALSAFGGRYLKGNGLSLRVVSNANQIRLVSQMRELERPNSKLKTVNRVDDLREMLAPSRRSGERIGLVPTMGAFHEGHLSLMERARECCDVVVVSLFVNPTQFGRGEDLGNYPRDDEGDALKACDIGVDILFAPPPEEVYPAEFSTFVEVEKLSEVLCGDPRLRGPSHFRGVATVVAKLFNMVQPNVAFFGQKDAQQARIIRQMTRDLNFPIEIEVLPTVREPDGLAMSSRNAYLSPEERRRAQALSRALKASRATLMNGARDISDVVGAAEAELNSFGVQAEYIEVVSVESLRPPKRLEGELLVAIAAQVGKARLIDNELVIVSKPEETHAKADDEIEDPQGHGGRL